MLLALLLAAATIQEPACQPLHADRIYGRDLGAVFPVFQALPPDQPLGLAPMPGQRRVFRTSDLVRIAQANKIDGDITGETCFEWTRGVPDAAQIRTAMEAALASSQATVEIVELPANPIPPGEIIFPLTGISGYADGPIVWRGTVTYAPNRNLPIWARVRITAHGKRVVATETLHPGSPVTPAAIKVEDYAGPFRRERNFADLQQVIGLMPCATINAGTVLTSSMLREPIAVERGETVQVIVQIDRTRIETQGIAEQSGPIGSVVAVRNQKSGRVFRARVEDRDRVSVLPTSTAGLVAEDPRS